MYGPGEGDSAKAPNDLAPAVQLMNLPLAATETMFPVVYPNDLAPAVQFTKSPDITIEVTPEPDVDPNESVPDEQFLNVPESVDEPL